MSIYKHLDASLPPQPNPTRMSGRGQALLHEFEGFRADAYLDSVGIWTIGYGNTRYEDGTPVRQGDHVTRARAAELFLNILRGFEDAVSTSVKVPVNQNQFDALVCLAYNIGSAAFQGSTLLRKLNEGDYQGAADEFPRWNRGGGRVIAGLSNRRARERELFLQPA